jgi:hypothetical protein
MQGMHHLNVHILDGENELTHWVGSPSVEGGELNGVDMSPVGGPPVWDYDTSGNDRTQYRFTVETKIIGTSEAAQKAFIAKYAVGTQFPDAVISGVPEGLDWVVAMANPTHNAENEPSTLQIRLDEVGPAGTLSSGSGSG